MFLTDRLVCVRSKRRKPRRRRRTPALHWAIEALEDRVMLSAASAPDQPLTTAQQPVAVELAPVDSDSLIDLVALSSDGSLTIAINGGDDSWNSVQTTDLGLGPLNGLDVAPLNLADFFADVIVQGPDSISVLLSNGAGQLALVQTITPVALGTLAPAAGGRVGMQATLLDQDFVADLVGTGVGLAVAVGLRRFGWYPVDSSVDPNRGHVE